MVLLHSSLQDIKGCHEAFLWLFSLPNETRQVPMSLLIGYVLEALAALVALH